MFHSSSVSLEMKTFNQSINQININSHFQERKRECKYQKYKRIISCLGFSFPAIFACDLAWCRKARLIPAAGCLPPAELVKRHRRRGVVLVNDAAVVEYRSAIARCNPEYLECFRPAGWIFADGADPHLIALILNNSRPIIQSEINQSDGNKQKAATE